MRGLLDTLVAICLLRSGPQDLPYSPRLARQLVLVLLVAQAVFLLLLDEQERFLGQMIYGLAWILLPAWLLLQLRGLQTRYVQTLTAKCGVGLLYLVVLVPLALALRTVDTTTPDVRPEPWQVLAFWGFVGVTVWHLAVSAHIWRHALSLPRFLGTVIAIGLFVANVMLGRLLFGSAS